MCTGVYIKIKLIQQMILGHTPMDVAIAWADPRVVDVVQLKWESLPAMGDKKGGKGKKGKGGGGKTTRPSSGPAPEAKENVAVSINPVCLADFSCEIYVCSLNYCKNM